MTMDGILYTSIGHWGMFRVPLPDRAMPAIIKAYRKPDPVPWRPGERA